MAQFNYRQFCRGQFNVGVQGSAHGGHNTTDAYDREIYLARRRADIERMNRDDEELIPILGMMFVEVTRE